MGKQLACMRLLGTCKSDQQDKITQQRNFSKKTVVSGHFIESKDIQTNLRNSK